MAQQKCLDQENSFYHVYNRGVNKQNIFLEDYDRYYFLKLCRKAKEKFNIKIHAFCLMNNHYHLLVHTTKANLSKTMKYLGERYAKYFVQKYKALKKSGHTFMGRYGRKIIQDDSYMKTLLNYIHLNPVKDGFSSHPEYFRWSSYMSYKNNQDLFKFIDLQELRVHFKEYSSNDLVEIQNHIQEINPSELKITTIINSEQMRAHLSEYKVDNVTYKKLVSYCLLEWTELDSYDLEKELDMQASSIRKLKSNVKFELEDNNQLLENLVYNVRKHFGLF